MCPGCGIDTLDEGLVGLALSANVRSIDPSLLVSSGEPLMNSTVPSNAFACLKSAMRDL